MVGFTPGVCSELKVDSSLVIGSTEMVRLYSNCRLHSKCMLCLKAKFHHKVRLFGRDTRPLPKGKL
jgi:hypothetical protein